MISCLPKIILLRRERNHGGVNVAGIGNRNHMRDHQYLSESTTTRAPRKNKAVVKSSHLFRTIKTLLDLMRMNFENLRKQFASVILWRSISASLNFLHFFISSTYQIKFISSTYIFVFFFVKLFGIIFLMLKHGSIILFGLNATQWCMACALPHFHCTRRAMEQWAMSIKNNKLELQK